MIWSLKGSYLCSPIPMSHFYWALKSGGRKRSLMGFNITLCQHRFGITFWWLCGTVDFIHGYSGEGDDDMELVIETQARPDGMGYAYSASKISWCCPDMSKAWLTQVIGLGNLRQAICTDTTVRIASCGFALRHCPYCGTKIVIW